MNTSNVQQRVEDLCMRLGLTANAKARGQITVTSSGLPPVELDIVGGSSVKWVTVRAPGMHSRSVFPTKEPDELPKAVVRNVLLSILDLTIRQWEEEALG